MLPKKRKGVYLEMGRADGKGTRARCEESVCGGVKKDDYFWFKKD